MTSVWAGYRYALFTFLMLNPAFVLILSAQNIETGGLDDGGKKYHIFTLIVSIFSTFFLGLVLWFDLTKKISIISEVRWEMIWVATVILFDIIGIASIASNRPASNTCSRPDHSNWNICSASGGIIALLILATIALTIHALILIVMIVRQSGRTVHSVWSFIARELPYALEPTPSIPVDFAPGVTTSPSSIHMDERPKSLPPVPQSEVAPPPVAYGGYREPFTFNSVTSILNSLAPQEAPKTYQLYDTPIPIARPPVQKSFERISGTGSISGRGSVSLSGHYNPTPLYERFARGGREVSVPARSTPSPPPVTSPVRPRRKEGDFVPWHAMDQHDLRRARTREPEIRATTPERDLSQTQSLPERSLSRPPRILPGTLPNPNIHRSLRRP